ncbi:hypothetical protein CP533_3020 [Ophiocordyceps camponoti-saundersi (nom. inval.)]|nr:hypothetical protein CP533_3020 [Ophiocordyceps camponoti-saundersi (nom. inval.)]
MPPRKSSAANQPTTSRRRSQRLVSSTSKRNYTQVVDEDDDDEDDVRGPPAKRKSGRQLSKGFPNNRSYEEEKTEEDEEDWEEEAEDEESGDDQNGDDDNDNDGDEDEDDEDAPPKVKIIPLEKLRDEGGVSYEDDKLHKNSLLFLKDLKANNKRSWLKAHDGEYRRALKDWQSFVEEATQRVIQVDETVPELPAKDVIFRIHRDIRFSKDPTPYKAPWSRTGRKGPYACYYLHCEPGSSFFGGGLWHPEAQSVARLRHSIDRRPARWRRVLDEPLLRKHFFPGVKPGGGPEAAVRAFIGMNQDNALKKRPMGYEVTHRDIELLKLRNFTVRKSFDADILCRDDAMQTVADMVQALLGLVSFLNSIVMPDSNLNGENGSSGEEAETTTAEEED